MSANKVGVIYNPYQTEAKRVLCVCSAGCLRSPTIANVLYQNFGYNTRSAGTEKEFALIAVDEGLVLWADEIVAAESHHLQKIEHDFNTFISPKKRLVSLNIPDIYHWNDPALRRIIFDNYVQATGR